MAHVDMFHIKDHVFLVVIYNAFMPWIKQMYHYILSLFDIVPTFRSNYNKCSKQYCEMTLSCIATAII